MEISNPEKAHSENAEAEIVDFEEIRHLWIAVTGAVRRHGKLSLTIFLSFVAATAGLILLFPRSYHTRCQILAQRNLVMPALGNPKRAVPIDSDTPTRAVSETILAHDNLVLLIKQLNLLDEWEASRAPILRFKDWVLDRVRGPLDDKEKLEALTGFLEKRLAVTTEDETVTIEVEWPDAVMAAQLIDTAQRNFLSERHQTEVSTIAETIAILESHATSLRQTIEGTLGQIEQEKSSKAKAQKEQDDRGAVKVKKETAHESRWPKQKIAELQETLEATRRAISAMEAARVQEINQVRTRLEEENTVYASANPLVVATQERLHALDADPPQLQILRATEQRLVAQYQEAAAEPAPSDLRNLERRVRRARGSRASDGRDSDNRDGEDDVDYPKVQLKTASDDYEDLLRRVEGARIELETTEAAFKYRYRLIMPPEVPKKPTKPNIPVVVAAGLLFGLLGSLLAALLADLGDGVLHDAWQVHQRLKIPVLGEVRST